MIYLTMVFIFVFCAVYSYYYQAPALGKKLGLKKGLINTKRNYSDFEFSFLSKLNYFKNLSLYASNNGAYVTTGHIGFVAVISTVIGFILATIIFRSLTLSVVFTSIVFLLVPLIYMHLLVGRQREKISAQLGGVLLPLTSSLRAGKTIVESIKAAGNEVPPPLGTELIKVYNAVKHGGEDLNSALKKMLIRSGNHYMLQKIIFAITITRTTGGNVAKALDGIGRMIDDELYTQEFAKSHSAHGKMIAIVFNAVVFFVVFNMNKVMPGAAAEYFFSSFRGQAILFICIMAIIGGWIMIFRMLSRVFDL